VKQGDFEQKYSLPYWQAAGKTYLIAKNKNLSAMQTGFSFPD